MRWIIFFLFFVTLFCLFVFLQDIDQKDFFIKEEEEEDEVGLDDDDFEFEIKEEKPKKKKKVKKDEPVKEYFCEHCGKSK